MTSDTKKCRTCHQRKQASEFYAKRKDCKACISEINKKARAMRSDNKEFQRAENIRQAKGIKPSVEMNEADWAICPKCYQLKHHSEFPKHTGRQRRVCGDCKGRRLPNV